MTLIYSMFYDETKQRQVVMLAPDYQVKLLAEYTEALAQRSQPIDYAADNSIHYTLTDPAINVSLNTFNYIKMNLESEYKDFYEVVAGDGCRSILSANESTLRGFCGWINRLTN